MYCVGGSLKNLCHFEMGGLANADVIRGALNVDRGDGGKIFQNLADVICERSPIQAWVHRCVRATPKKFWVVHSVKILLNSSTKIAFLGPNLTYLNFKIDYN